MSSEYKMTLSLQTLPTADPEAKAVLERAKAQLGFIPNMYAVMANSPGLLETDTLLATRGQPSKADVQAFLSAGNQERHVLEVILAIAVKTLSNYSNHLFHTPLDRVFASREWKRSA